MKQKLLLGIGTALLGLSGALAAESVPYSSPIGEVVGGVGQFCSGWTMVDYNNDEVKWAVDNSEGFYYASPRIGYSETQSMDDWMISPAITLKAGTEYTVSLYYAPYGEPERFRVVASTSNTLVPVSGGYTTLQDGTQIALVEPQDETDFTLKECKFTPTADGDYYFGIQCCSDKNGFELCIKDFSITGDATPVDPSDPTDPSDPDDPSDPEPFSFGPELFTDNIPSEWTIIDSNADECTWYRGYAQYAPSYKTSAEITYNKDNTAEPKNDWLISPALALEAGKSYSISYNFKSGDNNTQELLTTYLSKSITPAEIKESTLIEDHVIQSSSYASVEKVVTITETGDYYLAFYAHSAADKFKINVTNIAVKEVEPVDPTPVDPDPVKAPTTLEDLTVWASDDNSITSPRVIFESGLGYEIQVSHAYTEGSFSVSFVNDSESKEIGTLDLSKNPAVLQITAMDPAEAASFAAIPDGFTQVPSGTWRIKLTGSEKPVISKLAIVRNATGVELLEADGLRICGNAISLARAARVQVFAVDGKVLLDKVTDAVELSNLPAGVLLVKVGNRTVKITR